MTAPMSDEKPKRRTRARELSEIFVSNTFVLVFSAMLLAAHVLLEQTGDNGLSVVDGDGLWFLLAGGLIGSSRSGGPAVPPKD